MLLAGAARAANTVRSGNSGLSGPPAGQTADKLQFCYALRADCEDPRLHVKVETSPSRTWSTRPRYAGAKWAPMSCEALFIHALQQLDGNFRI